MAIKLESKNNFLVVTNTVSGDINNYPPQKIRFKIYSDTLHLIYMDRYADDQRYPLSEIVDFEDLAFDDLNAWLLLNTGNVNLTDVSIQSSTSPLVIIKATEVKGETTLTALSVQDTKVFNVADATGAVVGEIITVFSTVENRVSFFDIIAINVNEITVDSLIDFAYNIGDFVQFGSANLAVDGSVTPRVFGIRNPGSEDIEFTVDFTRTILTMSLTSAGHYDEFGNLPRLTNGLLCRFVDSYKQNIFNVKSNRELDNLMFDFKFIAASGNAPDGLGGRFTFEKLGSVIRLKPFEDLQFIVEDDLTDLDVFEILVQGAGVTN